MKRLCRVSRLVHFGGDETSVAVECERKHGHGGRHRCSWWCGDGLRRWKIRVTWR